MSQIWDFEVIYLVLSVRHVVIFLGFSHYNDL